MKYKIPTPKNEGISILCKTCEHYQGIYDKLPTQLPDPDAPDVYVCRAFPLPRGIPKSVIEGNSDHRKKIKGDSGIIYQPRFPVLFNRLSGWNNFNKWALQHRLPDGKTLYKAWQPAVKESIQILCSPKPTSPTGAFDPIAFNYDSLDILRENVRKGHKPLKNIAAEARQRIREWPKSEYGIAASLGMFLQSVKGDSAFPDGNVQPNINTDKAKLVYSRMLGRLILKHVGSHTLDTDTVVLLKPRYKNLEGTFRLALLSNGLFQMTKSNFRRIAKEYSQ